MSKANEEYELQLFNFTVKELQESQREIIEHRCNVLVGNLVKSIVANSPDMSAEQAADCRSAIGDVTAAILKSAAPQLARIDRKIADTFSIPAFVVLPENQLQARHAIGADEEQRLATELQQLQQQFNQQAQFITAMDAELRLHRELEPSQMAELAMMELVEQSLQESTTSTEVCRASVAELKRVLRDGGDEVK